AAVVIVVDLQLAVRRRAGALRKGHLLAIDHDLDRGMHPQRLALAFDFTSEQRVVDAFAVIEQRPFFQRFESRTKRHRISSLARAMMGLVKTVQKGTGRGMRTCPGDNGEAADRKPALLSRRSPSTADLPDHFLTGPRKRTCSNRSFPLSAFLLP